MLIRFSLAELKAINKIRSQHECLNQLFHRLLIAHVRDIGLRQRNELVALLGGGGTLQDF